MFEIALEIYILKKRDLNISKTLDLGKKEARGGTPSLSSVTRKTELLPSALQGLENSDWLTWVF